MEESPPEGHKRKRFLRWPLYIVSFVIPILGLGLGLFYLSKQDPEVKRSGKICIIIGVCSLLVIIPVNVIFYNDMQNFINNIGKPLPHLSINVTTTSTTANWTMLVTGIDGAESLAYADVSMLMIFKNTTNPTVTYNLTGAVSGIYRQGIAFFEINSTGSLNKGDYFVLDRTAYGPGIEVIIVGENRMIWDGVLK